MSRKPTSSKGLFTAIKAKPKGDMLFEDLPTYSRGAERDPLDYDPTPPDATRAFLQREISAIQVHGREVWEPCVGGGHIARELQRWGLDVIGNDVVDRGWPGTSLRSFYDYARAPSKIIISNPPYGEISARDGHGRWLKHSFASGARYIAYLLNADWPAARINGHDQLFEEYPPTVEYVCCWKIDFRGLGSPPQRNSWFVWDLDRGHLGPGAWMRMRLYRDDPSRLDADQMNLGI